MLLEFCGVVGIHPLYPKLGISPVKWQHVTAPLKNLVAGAGIDREARKGKPLPSDHAPLVIDIDSPGHAYDAGWSSAESRIAARQS